VLSQWRPLMRVAIIGAGIGGLTTALALHRRGIEVTVFEQVAEIRALGVGINLLPHAVGVLSSLGLANRLAATGVDAHELVFMNRHGQQILVDPRGVAAGYAYPQYSIHRGELQMILVDAVVAAIGTDRIRTSHRLVDFESDGRGVRARFVDRDGRRTHPAFDADVLVAADGIHSTVRARCCPYEGPPKWNGVQLWRGVTLAAPFLTGHSQIWAGSSAQKFVCYPISGPDATTGLALLNWVCDLRVEGAVQTRREDWNRPGNLDDFLPRFERWRFPCLDVPAVVRGTRAVYEFPMVDRDPLERWSVGRVTLLGDAAHPMYPIGSNGASQAILDAVALADALATIPDPARALTHYEAERRPMTAEIVRMNRSQGLDAILDLVEARAPEGFTSIDDVIPASELQAIVARYKHAAGHQQRR
jgi:5-methylphenazine-1-carboxylate 1-monooxygenase